MASFAQSKKKLQKLEESINKSISCFKLLYYLYAFVTRSGKKLVEASWVQFPDLLGIVNRRSVINFALR